MSNQFTLKISGEQAKEMPMVDLAFMILKAVNTPMYYRDLMQEIAKIKEIGDEQVNEVIAQLYTEINIDGRFACVGTNLWGLKRWYPLEKAEDQMGAPRPRIINDDDDDLDDDADIFEDEDDSYSSEDDEENFDELGDEDDDAEAFDDADSEDIDEDLDEDLDEELEDELLEDEEVDSEEEEELEEDDYDLDEDEDDDLKK